MASRMMHLTIADGILKEISIGDSNRFKIGSILPDTYSAGINTAVSHLKTRICNGTKSTYRLGYFRETYGKEMLKDPLYLGYYMHLIQDILFRQFVYDEYKWDPMPAGNVDRLHNDYHLLNTYVIEKYNISNDLIITEELKREKLFEIYPFDLQQLKTGLGYDFQPYREGNIFFFTTNMADEYIHKTLSRCVEEIKALQNGTYLIDEETYAWNAHS